MKGCAFVTQEDAAYGFGLAGCRQVIADGDNVYTIVASMVREMGQGLVIIDERLVDDAFYHRIRFLEKQWDGAIVLLPAPDEEGSDESGDHGLRFIAKVLGYQMNIAG